MQTIQGITTNGTYVPIQVDSQGRLLTSGGGSSANAMGVAIHGSNASFARPSGYTVVTWIGSVQPTNAISPDIWVYKA